LIAIDTNVILRFLTRQPKAQFAEAKQLLNFDRAFAKRAAKLKVQPTVGVP
jgi:predicted nucleic-acid-binding protein